MNESIRNQGKMEDLRGIPGGRKLIIVMKDAAEVLMIIKEAKKVVQWN